MNVRTVPRPVYCDGLSRRGVEFVGKTAEVGSVALSRGGQLAHMWGGSVDSQVPLSFEAASMSTVPDDVIVDASCEHDSGSLFVFASGLVYQHDRYLVYQHERHPELESAMCPVTVVASDQLLVGNEEPQRVSIRFLQPPISQALKPDERPVKGLGSQAGLTGVLTNQSRLLYWARGAEDVSIVEPIDDNERSFEIQSVAFGHLSWFAISTEGLLFGMSLRDRTRCRCWSLLWDGMNVVTSARMLQNTARTAARATSQNAAECCSELEEAEHEALKPASVVSCDCGSSHQGFVLGDGRVFTWGANIHDMLGLELGDTAAVKTPQEVSFFRERGMKVVAIGCGADAGWVGAYTLFLCDDNTLWQAGMLGEMNCSTPQQIVSDEIVSRHILSISCGENWAGLVASGLDTDDAKAVATAAVGACSSEAVDQVADSLHESETGCSSESE